MYICIMDKEGNKLVHKNIRDNDFEYFLKLATPYKHDLTVASECIFNWYWLADACEENGIEFVLGHALYMRSIYGTKTKNDRIDSEKIANLLRTNHLPKAHVCSKENRFIRDLLRRRTTMVRMRAELKSHMNILIHVENGDPLTQFEKCRSRRTELIPAKFNNTVNKQSVEADLHMIVEYDKTIYKLEAEVHKHTKLHLSQEYSILRSIPGMGVTCSLTVLYEIDNIDRFKSCGDFCSYSRVVYPTAESAGKLYRGHNRKIGNAYLKWAFTEAAVQCKRHHEYLQKYFDKLNSIHGKTKANCIIRHRMARAVYYMLKNKTTFDINMFLKGKVKLK